MSRNMGLTQRERLRLNLLQNADYLKLRYREPTSFLWWLVPCVAFWAFVIAWLA